MEWEEAPVQEGALAAVVFNILHPFPDRSILEQGQKGNAFGLGHEPKPYIPSFLLRFKPNRSHMCNLFLIFLKIRSPFGLGSGMNRGLIWCFF